MHLKQSKSISYSSKRETIANSKTLTGSTSTIFRKPKLLEVDLNILLRFFDQCKTTKSALCKKCFGQMQPLKVFLREVAEL